MRTSASSIVLLLLVSSTTVVANSFWLRADEPPPEATDESTASSSTGTATSATETSTAPPAAQTNTNGTAAVTSTSSDTAAATSSSSTTAAATPSATCHKSSSVKPEEQISNVFCEPREGQMIETGKKYPVSWDPHLFKTNSSNSVKASLVTSSDASGKTNATVIWSHVPIANEIGQVNDFIIRPEDLQGAKNNTLITLFIVSESEELESPETKSGPTLNLITNGTDSKNSTSHGKDSHIGENAGIPVGLGVFLIAAAGLIFWLIRRRKKNSAGYMAKRKGASRMTGDESGTGGGGGGGFRDEPTRGMELQDRQGRGRQDSWEAGWDSTSSQGGGNTFRDEIDRQRRR
ncbi:MAG: hypothetical protein Q9186_000453 [Xanthomendoza sp. 1 TL-2023]